MKESQNILFVDSDEDMRHVFGARLRQHGHTVTFASNAEEAVGLMRQHKNAYDLIITDLHLAGEKSGMDVIQEGDILQAKGRFWLISASLDHNEAQMAYRAQAKIAVNKVDLDSMLQKEGFLPY